MKVTGDLCVENCLGLSFMAIVFPRDALPPASLIVRNCPSIYTIGRVSGVRRTCRDLTQADCPVLSVIHADSIVRRERRNAGCPPRRHGAE